MWRRYCTDLSWRTLDDGREGPEMGRLEPDGAEPQIPRYRSLETMRNRPNLPVSISESKVQRLAMGRVCTMVENSTPLPARPRQLELERVTEPRSHQ